MENEKYQFVNLSLKYHDVIDEIVKNPEFNLYLKSHREIEADYLLFREKKKPRFTYWACSLGGKPQYVVLTEDVSKEHPDYMAPWIEPDKETLWVTLISLKKGDLSPESGAEILKTFPPFCSKQIGALLADPEVKEETLLSLYEQMGFVKVATFIKGQGFFKGTAHYLMKLKL